MASKTIEVEGELYSLDKSLHMSSNQISESTTSLDELNKNPQDVIAMLLENGKITKSSRIQPQNNVGKNVGKDDMPHIIIK